MMMLVLLPYLVVKSRAENLRRLGCHVRRARAIRATITLAVNPLHM